METSCWICAIVTLLAVASLVGGVHNVRVVVPLAVRAGSSATLLCLYDLLGAPLYSVKWYRGRREFYRFVPGDKPQTRVFSFQGLAVDLTASGARQVTLVDVPLFLAGEYSCEVSADAPSFSTALASASLAVVDFAGGRPLLEVTDLYLSEDKPLVANCTATAPRLGFYINNVQVNSSEVEAWPGGATLTTSVSRGDISPPAAELRLKCVAFIGESLTVSSATTVLWWRTQLDNYTMSGGPTTLVSYLLAFVSVAFHTASRCWDQA